ncbi:MAG: hypothetical protein HY317_03530 [Acidobacteria bacterium]|nr:hypothetical protein [Acidobacteriota bacterium]
MRRRAELAMDVEAEIDRLYRIPLAGFTAARNALAARLQKGGLADAAARVRALAKPSATAWAANQVYWNSRGAFDRLVTAAGRVRDVLASGAPAEQIRRAMRARGDALAAAVLEAETALRDAGHAVSPAVLRRVQATLEALAAGTSSVAAGRLAEDLEPPGLDALVAADATRPPVFASEPSVAAVDEGKAGGRARAEAEATARRREADAAATAHAEAVRRLEGARAEVEEAQRRAERAEARLREAEAAAATAQAAAEAAARALEAAEAALGRAD